MKETACMGGCYVVDVSLPSRLLLSQKEFWFLPIGLFAFSIALYPLDDWLGVCYNSSK